MAIASLTIDLNARLANIERDMGRAAQIAERQSQHMQASFAKAGAAFAGIGAAIGVGSFGALIKSTIDAADSMNDLAIATGTSVESLASYKLAAEQSGTNVEGLARGLGKLSLFMANNSEEAAKLGITARDPVAAFAQLSDALASVQDPAQRNAVAAKVLGKSYAELMPLLAQGGDSLRQQAGASAQYAESMGKAAKQADAFNDSLAEFKQKASGIGISIANDLLPGMNAMLGRWKDAIDLSGKHGGFIGLILNGVNPTGKNSENLKNVTEQIRGLQYMLDNGGERSDTSKRNLEEKIAGLKAVRDSLKEIQQAEALDLNEKFGTSNYKGEGGEKKAGFTLNPDDIINAGDAEKLQKTLEKAFSTKPIDDYIASLGKKKLDIKAEYAKLNAELTSTPIGDNLQSLDVSAQIGKARMSLSGGDQAGAQANIDRAKEMLKALDGQGEADFMISYLSKEMQRFEEQMVDGAETAAEKTKAEWVKKTTEINQALKANPPLEMNVSVDNIVAQVTSAVDQIRANLQAKPLEVPVVAVPQVGKSGALSVDISRAAAKFGG